MIRGKQLYTKGVVIIDISDWDDSGGPQSLYASHGWEGAMAWGNLIHDELNMKGPGVQKGDIYLDLGANIGMSAINAELKGVSKLYCVEPDPGVFEALEKNKSANWEIFNIAISNENGEMDIPKWPNWWENYARPCVTLDEFFLQNNIDHIDYMKVDIEGHEKTVFSHVSQNTWNKINKIFIEYHEDLKKPIPERNIERDKFSETLRQKGFDGFDIIVGGYQSFMYFWKI